MMPEGTERDDGASRCVECGEIIPASARICSHCGSHQRRWRNEILFASTLVGIASVTVTALAFLISIWPEVRAVVAWTDEIEVVEFDGLGTIVIANRGDGPVYISDLRADVGPFAFVRRVNRVVEAGGLGIFEPDSVWAAAHSRYAARSRSSGIVPRDSIVSYLDPDGCHSVLVLSASSPTYRLWETRMGDEFPLLDEPAQVVVRYHGVDSGVSFEDTLAVPTVAGTDMSCMEGS